jgi:hypothetical protein
MVRTHIEFHQPSPVVCGGDRKQGPVEGFAECAPRWHCHAHVVMIEGAGQNLDPTGELGSHEVPQYCLIENECIDLFMNDRL